MTLLMVTMMRIRLLNLKAESKASIVMTLKTQTDHRQAKGIDVSGQVSQLRVG